MTQSQPSVILHGLWTDLHLHLWGERCVEHAEPSDSTSGGAGAPAVSTDARRDHPRALTTDQLHALAGELSGDGLLATVADESSLELWLPTESNHPSVGAPDGVPASAPTDLQSQPPPPASESLPVAEGVAPRDSGAQDWELSLWRIPTLMLAPPDALDLLATISTSGGAAIGNSLKFWARLAEYVVACLARQQFAPILRETSTGDFEACWRAVVQHDDEHRWLEGMASAMPPVCRAVRRSQPSPATAGTRHHVPQSMAGNGRPSGDRPPSAAALLESFLHTTIDATIRRNLAADSFFDQIHHRDEATAGWEVGWLSALLGDDDRVRVPREDLAQVSPQLRAWLSRIDRASPDDSARLCLSLEEPDASEEADSPNSWRLRFSLESVTDDRVLPLDVVFDEANAASSILQSQLAGHRDFYVAELNRAAQLLPVIQQALVDPCPTEVHLSAGEAHEFMHRGSPLLEANGIRTVLPDWAGQRDHYLGIKLVVQPVADLPNPGGSSSSSFGLDSLVGFNWRLAVGDRELSEEDLNRLATATAPLVKLHGQWLEVDPEGVRSALEFVKRQESREGSLGELIRLGSGAMEASGGLPVVGLEGTSWLATLLNELPTAKMTLVDQPKEFRGELRGYQLRGLSWLVFLDSLGLGACLADDMGLGKTIQLIALLLHERQSDRAVGPTLLLAPMSVVGNWRRELERFAPHLRVLVYQGPDRPMGEDFDAVVGDHDVVLATYGLIGRARSDLRRVAWHRVALDEAQKIKNPNTAQTRAIRALSASKRVALTGTPIENHLSDLWSISEFLNPGLLQSASEFRTRFAVPIEKLGDKERSSQLRRLIRPFLLRRLKSDPEVDCDLPEKMEMRVFCNLTVEQAHHYELIVNEMLGGADSATGIRRRAVILAGLTRLKQICNHPRQYLRDDGPLEGRSGKCERLVEMLEEVMEEGEAALVFTQYRQASLLLHELLSKHLDTEVLLMHGGCSAAQRDQMVERFQEAKGDTRVFVLSLKTGGFGLNLTAASHVFHFDRWWNPAVEAQATDRTHRIGQTRRVQVHKFVCIGTIEERIDQLLEDKRALADQIMSSGDGWLTSLSTKELGEYIRLSSEAVAEG